MKIDNCAKERYIRNALDVFRKYGLDYYFRARALEVLISGPGPKVPGPDISEYIIALSDSFEEWDDHQRARMIQLQEENNQLKARLADFENGNVAAQCDMDDTIEQNMRLKKTVERLEAQYEINHLKETCTAKYKCNESAGRAVPCYTIIDCRKCSQRKGPNENERG